MCTVVLNPRSACLLFFVFSLNSIWQENSFFASKILRRIKLLPSGVSQEIEREGEGKRNGEGEEGARMGNSRSFIAFLCIRPPVSLASSTGFPVYIRLVMGVYKTHKKPSHSKVRLRRDGPRGSRRLPVVSGRGVVIGTSHFFNPFPTLVFLPFFTLNKWQEGKLTLVGWGVAGLPCLAVLKS